MTLVTDPIDLLLGDDGDLAFTDGLELQWSTGLDAVEQSVRIAIRRFAGEWFADTSIGVPWFDSILGAKYNERTIRAAIRDAIVDAPGVARLEQLALSFDRPNRALTIAWRVTAEFGDTVTGQETVQ